MWITHVQLATLLVLAGILCKEAFCLRLIDVEVPAAVIMGEPVWLNCSFDLESDELYSVKWYRNTVEFYRYLPNDHPPAQIYRAEGVYVDLDKSNVGSVLLSRTDLKSDGVYRCEVSADAPYFQTVRKEKEMRVYVLPKEGPTISGVRQQYEVGDTVNVNCTAGPSKPPAILTWYINGKEAPPEYYVRFSSIRQKSGLQVASLGLMFGARPSHFRQGVMRLRCTAVISQAYSMSSEEIVVGDTARSAGLTSGSEGEGPIITGGRPIYHVGNIVDVNCTSAKTKPAAELRWFINDKEARPEYLRHYPRTRHPNGQETSVLGLSFVVERSHFVRNEMRLKCTATLSKVINTTSEEAVLGSSHQSSGLHVSENGASTIVGSGVNCLGCVAWNIATTLIFVTLSALL